MTNDLTAQVAEAMTDVLPERMFGPLAGALAPRIAACMRAVVRRATEINWDVAALGDPNVQENACLAAGLAALRGKETR